MQASQQASPTPVPEAQAEPGLDVGLLLLFAVIVAGIAASNRWLRRRAERERDQSSKEP